MTLSIPLKIFRLSLSRKNVMNGTITRIAIIDTKLLSKVEISLKELTMYEEIADSIFLDNDPSAKNGTYL